MTPPQDIPPPNEFVVAEDAAFNAYEQSAIDLRGYVVDPDGVPVEGAEVAIQAGVVAVSDENGAYRFEKLPRRNELLTIRAPGYRIAVHAVHLARAASVTEVEVVAALVLRRSDEVRFLFTGDTAFGRRFIDVDESTPRDKLPPDDPDALIQVSNPGPGSKATARYVKPLFDDVDFPVVNLETPVTENPNTPHTSKNYSFFTLPGSLEALTMLGVSYVTLGNNHLYDYLEQGVSDTLVNLAAASIGQSGGGRNAAEAFTPYRKEIKGYPYSFLSMMSVSGSQYPIDFVATETKGGAADLRDDVAVTTAITTEIADKRIPIVILHTGKEYAFRASEYAIDRIDLATEAGATLIVGHHPHVGEGVSFSGDMLAIHSLGNFIFDQARLETMTGLLATVDMAGRTLARARLRCVYLEDYQPRPIAGDLSQRELRRIGELSEGVGLAGLSTDEAWIVRDQTQLVRRSRTISVPVSIPERGWTVVDLRNHAASDESLAMLKSSAEDSDLQARVGRDILLHGDFEDYDTDEDLFEAARWDLTGDASFVCVQRPYRGAAALCIARSDSNADDAVAPFRNRARVMGDAEAQPNKDLSVYGYLRAENGGVITVVARYYASFGDAEFGEGRFSYEGGDFDWRPFSEDLAMPADTGADPNDPALHARAVRLFIRHAPPSEGDGMISVDEVAVINWEEAVDLSGHKALYTPHARDYVRLEGSPGDYVLSLTFHSYRPVELSVD